MPRRHQGLSLLYLFGGMGLGWWAYTILPDVLSVLRFGTVGAVQFSTRHALLACSGVALITGVWGMLAAPTHLRRMLQNNPADLLLTYNWGAIEAVMAACWKGGGAFRS